MFLYQKLEYSYKHLNSLEEPKESVMPNNNVIEQTENNEEKN